MCRSENAEIATINGENLRNIQSLRHRDNAGVDEIDIRVVVFAEDLGGAKVVLACRILDDEIGIGKALNKFDYRAKPNVTTEKVCNFGDSRTG